MNVTQAGLYLMNGPTRSHRIASDDYLRISKNARRSFAIPGHL